MSAKIEDYALIGDCETAALVSRDGSIDWLCVPRFDSGACFASLVGSAENGRWQIAPTEPITAVRRTYRGETLILETEFDTASGTVRVIDFMPLRDRSADVVRIVEGVSGTVCMKMELVIRFDYGSVVPWVKKLKEGGGLRATAGPNTLYCRAPIELRGEGMTTTAAFDVKPEERLPFTLTWKSSHLPPPPARDAEESLRTCEAWWNEWAGRCTYQGHAREAVMRSLITLKALTFAPTGGIVAAPTTSLPERIGGASNWDYRYCWLRDATFSLLALAVGGYTAEAKQWRQWLENAVAGAPADTQIMYSVGGDRRLAEWEAPWLAGYEGSKPVRIGNAAYRQQQLDVFGEVIDALYQARKLGLSEDIDTWHIEVALLRHLEKHWREPDQGIWESRDPPQHYTYSKVMAWVAFDRAVKSVEEFGVEGDAVHWACVRDEIHAQICRKGYDTALQTFVAYYGAKESDASLLLLPLVGFLLSADARLHTTIDFARRSLLRDGFVMRHPVVHDESSLTTGEGTFLLCSFWLVNCLALLGQRDEAHELFDRLVAIRNDVGLLSEEYDPIAKRLLGNFPQAFSHVGLINAAVSLDSDSKRRD